jgi:hypothetical protein
MVWHGRREDARTFLASNGLLIPAGGCLMDDMLTVFVYLYILGYVQQSVNMFRSDMLDT